MTVTTVPLPSAPIGLNSVQCGQGVPTASVVSTSGLSSPVFRWYGAATGGTPLQSGASTTYGTAIGTTTSLYVAEFDGTCESTRTPVTVTVDTPPAITTSGPATICRGDSTTITVTSSNPGYVYSWSNEAGTGPIITVSPTNTTTYTVTAMDPSTGQTYSGCNVSATVTITVKNPSLPVTVTASLSTICEGGSTTLTATGGGAYDTYVSGNLNNVNSPTGYPAPFSNYYGGSKHQWMYTAAELTALGYLPGDKITSIGLRVNEVGTNFTGTLTNFTVHVKNADALSALTTTFETNLTQVASLNLNVPKTGLPAWVTVTFSTAFTWTGGALVVQTSYSNGNSEIGRAHV